MSIRKVLGATGRDLSLTLSKEVIILLSIAIVLAAPLAFYYLNSFSTDWIQIPHNYRSIYVGSGHYFHVPYCVANHTVPIVEDYSDKSR